MIEEQGKYSVIFLTLKEIKGNNIESMYTQIKTLISDLFNQYEYLRENLNERDIEIFDNLWKRKDEKNNLYSKYNRNFKRTLPQI